MTEQKKDSPPEIQSINEPPGSDVRPLLPEPDAAPGDVPPPEMPPPNAADPDEIEDEIEQAEEDGDVVRHRGGSGKPHRPHRR